MWLLRKVGIGRLLQIALLATIICLFSEIILKKLKKSQLRSATLEQVDLIDAGGIENNIVRTVLVLGYQRCGSSLTGLLFNSNPHAFFMFEPADGVYSAMYGIPNGWSVPTDIFNFRNGSYREIPEVEMNALSLTLNNLLTCDVRHVPTEVLAHSFMALWTKRQKKLQPFLKCIHSRKVKIDECRALIKTKCSKRFGESIHKENVCRTLLWDVRAHPADYSMTHFDSVIKNNTQYFQSDTLLGEPTETVVNRFKAYHACMDKLTQKMQECYPVIESLCKNSTIRSVKTVRVTMETAHSLLSILPDLHVVHIMRDPRPVTLSRQKQSSFRGRNSGKDLVKEAGFYCQRALQDVNIRHHLEKRTYPNSFYQMIYEDLAAAPVHSMEDLYQFLRSDIPDELRNWVIKNTHDNRNSTHAATTWMSQMGYDVAYSINKVCEGLNVEVNYTWP